MVAFIAELCPTLETIPGVQPVPQAEILLKMVLWYKIILFPASTNQSGFKHILSELLNQLQSLSFSICKTETSSDPDCLENQS